MLKGEIFLTSSSNDSDTFLASDLNGDSLGQGAGFILHKTIEKIPNHL